MNIDIGTLLQTLLVLFAIMGVLSIAFIIWQKISETQQEKELDKMRERQHLIIDIADQVELRIGKLLREQNEEYK